MERSNERVKISVNTANRVFFYTGLILDDVNGFIIIKDDKEGEIKINKSQIITVKSLGGYK